MNFVIVSGRHTPSFIGMKGNIILFLMIGISTLVHIRILRLFHYESRMTIT